MHSNRQSCYRYFIRIPKCKTLKKLERKTYILSSAHNTHAPTHIARRHTRTHNTHTDTNKQNTNKLNKPDKVKALQGWHVPRATHNHLREFVHCARIARSAAINLNKKGQKGHPFLCVSWEKCLHSVPLFLCGGLLSVCLSYAIDIRVCPCVKKNEIILEIVSACV